MNPAGSDQERPDVGPTPSDRQGPGATPPAEEDACAGFYRGEPDRRGQGDAPADGRPVRKWKSDWYAGVVACVAIGGIGGGVLAELGEHWLDWGQGWGPFLAPGEALLGLLFGLCPLKRLARRAAGGETSPQLGSWAELRAALRVSVPAYAMALAVVVGYVGFQKGVGHGLLGALAGAAIGAVLGTVASVAATLGFRR